MERLVPLVAAAAQDEVVHALRAENEGLRAEVSRLRADRGVMTVLVKGTDGVPVYARGRLSLRDCLRVMEDAQPLVAVELDTEEEASACRLGSLYSRRLIVSVETGFGPDLVTRLGFFREQVSVCARGDRLEFHVYMDADAVELTPVFKEIVVTVPAPPEVAESEDWFAAPSDLFEEAITERNPSGLPPAPFAVDADALVRFHSVVVDVSWLFKALSRGIDGDEDDADMGSGDDGNEVGADTYNDDWWGLRGQL